MGLIGGVVGGVLGGIVIVLVAALLFVMRRHQRQAGSKGNLPYKDIKRKSPELHGVPSPRPPAELHSPHTGAELHSPQSSQEKPDIERGRVWDESPVLGSFEIASQNSHTRNFG